MFNFTKKLQLVSFHFIQSNEMETDKHTQGLCDISQVLVSPRSYSPVLSKM